MAGDIPREDGLPLYAQRFAMVEPFYNGISRIETFEGSLALIDLRGELVRVLHPHS